MFIPPVATFSTLSILICSDTHAVCDHPRSFNVDVFQLNMSSRCFHTCILPDCGFFVEYKDKHDSFFKACIADSSSLTVLTTNWRESSHAVAWQLSDDCDVTKEKQCLSTLKAPTSSTQQTCSKLSTREGVQNNLSMVVPSENRSANARRHGIRSVSKSRRDATR